VHAKTPASTESFSRARGIEAFSELEAMLDRIDVLHVCIPPEQHEAVTILALERDIFAIVEKPLTGYFGAGGRISTAARHP
jgi:predicted dehydrogenase